MTKFKWSLVAACLFAASTCMNAQTQPQQAQKYMALVLAGDAGNDEIYINFPKDADGNIKEIEMRCQPRIYFTSPLREQLTLANGPGFENGYSLADSACLIDNAKFNVKFRVWILPPREGENKVRCVAQHVPVKLIKSCFTFQQKSK